MRVMDVEDEEDQTICMYLKELQNHLYSELALKGLFEISRSPSRSTTTST